MYMKTDCMLKGYFWGTDDSSILTRPEIIIMKVLRKKVKQFKILLHSEDLLHPRDYSVN